MSKPIKLPSSLSPPELFKEIGKIADNMENMLTSIIKTKNASNINLLAVELRKLLSPTEKGGSLLERAEKTFGITLRFTVSAMPPPNTKQVGLDEYIHGLAFFLRPRRWERIDIVKLVADEKGAHLDPAPDILHSQSQKIIIPVGNPKRGGLLFEQNQTYVINIARTVLGVIKQQILIPLKNKF